MPNIPITNRRVEHKQNHKSRINNTQMKPAAAATRPKGFALFRFVANNDVCLSFTECVYVEFSVDFFTDALVCGSKSSNNSSE
ncbi:unnamed protein product [Ceratitis capitata]|uniref:(Mediterranean fruit fly) hypothetical protein n=1 Tax=Ceratitis capitata TaxID=7213 RepID=A0A811UYD0_CERCA|nr:unnamed protein product [Ceratitis capitata]